MKVKHKLLIAITALVGLTLACSAVNNPFSFFTNTENKPPKPPELPPPILDGAFAPGEASADEPVIVTGTIPFTSPFFLDMSAEPFVLLEDQAGFVDRNKDFVFEDKGLMVFAVAFWSNVWGGPFLEEREGTGWSTAHSTTITDADRDYEIVSGHLIIWAPDDQQSFPSGFGDDEMLFTEDDPIQSVPPGYSIVDLTKEPLRVYKEPDPEFELLEGAWAVKDFSDLSYRKAFDSMFEIVSKEYPFTKEKNVDWEALYQEFAPLADRVLSDFEFYNFLREFTYAIPDGHVGVISDEHIGRAFYDEVGGSFGLVLAELSDGRVIVTKVLPGTTGADAGIRVGAEIITWDGVPVTQALDQVEPFIGPYSTSHHKRLGQLTFLPRYPIYSEITITYRNPGGAPKEVSLEAPLELDSFFESFPSFDPIELPIEAHTLDSGFGYIKINTFGDDMNLMAQVWERHIENILEAETPGLIIDLRDNGGGFTNLALDFAGYLFDETIVVARHSSYNDLLEEWEYSDYPTEIEPAPMYYDGPIVVLISPHCVSACESFTYLLTQNNRATVVGYNSTAGAYGGVGSGQFTMPGDIEMQFPTNRSETPDGDLLIEGVGIMPDDVVPLTYEDALGQADTLLEKAVEILQDLIN
jgi:C-terminal processing protease CtpA/Prc